LHTHEGAAFADHPGDGRVAHRDCHDDKDDCHGIAQAIKALHRNGNAADITNILPARHDPVIIRQIIDSLFRLLQSGPALRQRNLTGFKSRFCLLQKILILTVRSKLLPVFFQIPRIANQLQQNGQSLFSSCQIPFLPVQLLPGFV